MAGNGPAPRSDAEPIRVLVGEDDPAMLDLIRRVLADEGYEVLPARDGHEVMRGLDEGAFDLVLCDVRMPGPDGIQVLERAISRRLDQPVILMTAFGSIAAAVQAMRAGAYHYFAKPFDIEELIEVIAGAATQIRQLHAIRAQPAGAGARAFPIVFRSSAMARLLGLAHQVAASDATVLIQGPSGTGKELLARAVHAASLRHDRPFVPLDCSAIPEGLIESELFGHRRGAFTGAVADAPGIVERAAGGTLFLDEVSNLAAPVQAKLLRFLQERRYRRVGDAAEREVDVRLVSASNRDLAELVAAGAFRDDLYYRLSVFTLEIPAMAERREDIPPLVYHFIRTFNARGGYQVDGIRQDALDLLIDHPWPGNVRQLENAIERAVILRKAGLIQPSDLPEQVAPTSGPATHDGHSLEEVERRLILQLLGECRGNRTRVARILGISRRTVHRKLEKYGIA